MIRRLVSMGLAGLLCAGAALNMACPPAPPPVTPTTVTIEYVNNTSASVLVDLLTSNNPNITQDQLLADGTLFRDTVDTSGTPLTFDLACTDAQAIIIDRAVLLITDGPEIGSVILHQGTDFSCGQTASFTFTTNAGQTQLSVSFAHF